MSTESRQPLRTAWNYRWPIAIFAVFALLATYVVSKGASKKYEATALVQVVPGSESSGQFLDSDAQQNLVNTFVRYAETPAVYQAGAKAAGLGGDSDSFSGAVSVNPESDTTVLDLTATTGQPASAARYANAYASAFAAFVEQYESTQNTQTLQRIQAQIDKTVTAAAAPGTSTLEVAQLRSEANALREKLASTTAAPANSVQLLGSAAAPTSPSSPKPTRNALLALIVALVLGVGASLAYAALADRYRDGEEATADLGLPLLGELPRAGAAEQPAIEAFRRLRTAIVFAAQARRQSLLPEQERELTKGLAGTGGAIKILVAAADRGAGKSYTTAGLSRTLAADGWRVLAIDGDLRRPTLHAQLGVRPKPGLGDVLAGHGDPAELAQPAREANRAGRSVTEAQPGTLDVLAAGNAGPDTTERLSSVEMTGVLVGGSEEHDYLVLDSSPILPVVDAVVLARQSDGVVVVVDAHRSRRRDVRRAVQTLRAADAHVLGFVFNRVTNRVESYGYSAVAPSADLPSRAAELAS